MLFMGGRVLAPAIAGFEYGQGKTRSARAQPRLEGLLIPGMIAAIVFFAISAGQYIAGVLLIMTR